MITISWKDSFVPQVFSTSKLTIYVPGLDHLEDN